jgi:hypothetical protein
MTRIAVVRVLAAALGTSFLVTACGGGNNQPSENLASDQTLSFPMVDNPGNLDPAQMSAAVDIDVFRNTYSGLYKFDNQLNEVPDIADGMPQVSADGLTYTFKMKQNVKFSNGDPVKSDDFIFSWNRAAAMQGDLLAQVLLAERRALDMPAWPTPPPRTVPARLLGITRPAFPQGEVERVLFAGIVQVGVVLLAGDLEHLRPRESGQFAIARARGNSKKDAAAVSDVSGGAVEQGLDERVDRRDG